MNRWFVTIYSADTPTDAQPICELNDIVFQVHSLLALAKKSSANMPHGDFSDYAAFFCGGLGAAMIWAPQYLFQSVTVGGVTVGAFFEGNSDAMSPAIQFAGGLLMFMWLVLFVNRWNTVSRL